MTLARLGPPVRRRPLLQRSRDLAFAPRPAAAPASGIASLYGTGVGKIPLHLAPEDAVLDGSGNVVSLSNRGGAGAAFDTTAGGTITRPGNLLVVNGTGWLDMATPANLIGVRLFVVAAVDFPASGNTARTVASGDAGTPGTTTDDTSLELVFYPSSGTRNCRLTRGATQTVMSGIPTDGLRHLWEFEILPGGAGNIFVDGVLVGSNSALAGGPATIQRLFARTTTGAANLVGQVGGLASLVVDAATDLSAQIGVIRSELSSKY